MTKSVSVRAVLERVMRFWVGPTNGIRLETYRVAMGVSMLCYFGSWWLHAEEWVSRAGFHVSPATHSRVYMMPPVPPEWLPYMGVLFFGSLLLWILGWKTQWTCAIVFLFVVYFNYVDVLSAYTLNKMYVISMAIFLCVPHGHLWSIEKKGECASVSVWPVRIFQLTLIIHYFFAGYAKITSGDWAHDPNVLWTQVQGLYRTPVATWMLNTLPQAAWTWMQNAALMFEFGSPILFSIKKLRPLGLLWGMLFHVLVAATMHMLFFFSFQMLCLYIFFLDEGLLDRIRSRVKAKLIF